MFYPLPIYIGLRYLRAKRRDHFISFVTCAAMLGIALSVTVLITVLSVMNGFDETIRTRIFGIANQITIHRPGGQPFSEWPTLRRQVLSQPHVMAAAPFVVGQGLLIRANQYRPVQVVGVSPTLEQTVSHLLPELSVERGALQAGSYQMIVGAGLAADLQLRVGDRLHLMTPLAAATPIGVVPRFRRFEVSAVFQAGQGFNFDARLAYVSLRDAQALYQMGEGVSGLRLKVDDLYAAPRIAQALAAQLPSDFKTRNWTDEYGHLVTAIALEKNMMFCILSLLIAVSVFNLVSSLMMVVADKRSDIAILRTLGATPRTILAIFLVQGGIIGLLGTAVGLVGGVLLAQHVSTLADLLERLFHVQLLSSKVYFFVDHLPSRIEIADLIQICTAALGMSMLATLYPAWRAAQVMPAEALRYE